MPANLNVTEEVATNDHLHRASPTGRGRHARVSGAIGLGVAIEFLLAVWVGRAVYQA